MDDAPIKSVHCPDTKDREHEDVSASVGNIVSELTTETQLPTVNVIGTPVSAMSFEQQLDLMFSWAKHNVSRYVCLANSYVLTEAHHNPDYQAVLTKADLVVPEDDFLVWLIRAFAFKHQNRISRLNILLALCKRAEEEGQSIFFCCNFEGISSRMRTRLSADFPGLKVAGMVSIPYSHLIAEDNEALTETINESGADIVFVALSSPKQEDWMAQHRDHINAVMVGLIHCSNEKIRSI